MSLTRAGKSVRGDAGAVGIRVGTLRIKRAVPRTTTMRGAVVALMFLYGHAGHVVDSQRRTMGVANFRRQRGAPRQVRSNLLPGTKCVVGPRPRVVGRRGGVLEAADVLQVRNIGRTSADRRAARAKRRRARTVQHNATQEHSGRNNPRSVTRWRCPKRGGSYVTWRTCGLDCGVGTGWSVRPTGAVFLNSNMKEDSPPSSTTAQEHTGAVRNHMEPATTVAAPKQTRRSHMTAWHNGRTVVATAVPQDAAMVPHASASEHRCRVPTRLRSRVPKSPIRTSRTREPAARGPSPVASGRAMGRALGRALGRARLRAAKRPLKVVRLLFK